MAKTRQASRSSAEADPLPARWPGVMNGRTAKEYFGGLRHLFFAAIALGYLRPMYQTGSETAFHRDDLDAAIVLCKSNPDAVRSVPMGEGMASIGNALLYCNQRAEWERRFRSAAAA